jgi:hypothetical protein
MRYYRRTGRSPAEPGHFLRFGRDRWKALLNQYVPVGQNLGRVAVCGVLARLDLRVRSDLIILQSPPFIYYPKAGLLG